MTQFFGGASFYTNADGIQVNICSPNLKNYFSNLITQRQQNPSNDFLSILLKNKDAFG